MRLTVLPNGTTLGLFVGSPGRSLARCIAMLLERWGPVSHGAAGRGRGIMARTADCESGFGPARFFLGLAVAEVATTLWLARLSAMQEVPRISGRSRVGWGLLDLRRIFGLWSWSRVCAAWIRATRLGCVRTLCEIGV